MRKTTIVLTYLLFLLSPVLVFPQCGTLVWSDTGRTSSQCDWDGTWSPLASIEGKIDKYCDSYSYAFIKWGGTLMGTYLNMEPVQNSWADCQSQISSCSTAYNNCILSPDDDLCEIIIY